MLPDYSASRVPASKRIFDLVIGLILLILCLPFILVIGIAILLDMGSPVVFRQQRAGFKGRIFYINKFRSMRIARDITGKDLPEAQRLTRLGRFLRASSLDELPGLFNVLKGDMSLVGPRPLYAHYLQRYTAEQNRRHSVLPGITGWAQVNGRNLIDWDEKFRLDLWYVDHWSLWLDIKILFLTAWKAFKREGITPLGQAVSDEFLGENSSRK
jgi:lipopolysaccharide/colanic/teichoic acid biosynthesis glycosyltransferase